MNHLQRQLETIASFPTGTTSAGYPYLSKDAWRLLRDEVPILFRYGGEVLALAKELAAQTSTKPLQVEEAMAVVKQVVFTAAITAPPDLWLLRNVLSAFAILGLGQRLLAGEALVPSRTCVAGKPLDSQVLATHLEFLQGRGYVEKYDDGFRIAGHPKVQQVFSQASPRPRGLPASTVAWWTKVFRNQSLAPAEQALLEQMGCDIPTRKHALQNHWIASPEEVELGFRLLPVVLGLRAAEKTEELKKGVALQSGQWSTQYPQLEQAAGSILQAAGWVTKEDGGLRVTELGARGFERGPGPFGIIETYHAYLDQGVALLQQGTADVWVERGNNVGASQDANRRAFERANDALDQFCRDTGFQYRVFVEHAVGRGEATRIRFQRSGDQNICYFGADLEDAAIDAAQQEQARGVLPPNMQFVRHADIGCPEILADALEQAGVSKEASVMMVGNGFHEVRKQDFESMTAVFRGYQEMGMVLLFTEENALSMEDLRNTAWNTYHAGFKFVHDLSGQVLRPGVARSPYRSGHLMRAAWEECAQAAGYVRADTYCSRTRTIYPYPTKDGHNPAVSRNHFFVPQQLAKKLGLA